MISKIIPTIYSELGSSTSLLPMGVKDIAHSLGMTTSSYIAGDKLEGKDRLIDEFGAQAIWLGGIPFFKFLIDNTIYKAFKHNAKVDIRLLKNEKILKKAIEYAPQNTNIAKTIQHAADNTKTFKGLFLTRFILSTLMTLGAYGALTIFRHKHTEKNIIKDLQKEQELKKANHKFMHDKKLQAFKAFINQQPQQKKPSFGMNLNALKSFMFDPVRNMMIVDGGITAERLGESRNFQDFLGYVIKEGSFWFFMYFAGKEIQKHFEKRAETHHGISIGLDMKALQDPSLQKAIINKNINSDIKNFQGILNIEKTEKTSKSGKKQIIEKILNPEDIYEFVCKNPDNIIVKVAKKSGIIKTIKKSDDIDTRRFIDTDEVKGVADKLEKLMKQMADTKNEDTAEVFINKLISLKKGAILKNIFSCIGILGLIVPCLMLLARYIDKDNKEFQVKKQIEENMNKQMLA